MLDFEDILPQEEIKDARHTIKGSFKDVARQSQKSVSCFPKRLDFQDSPSPKIQKF